MKHDLKNHGFTLVEVLIVVAVIALLAAIAIPNFLRSRGTANDATAQATLKTISSALETYYSLNSIYPAVTTDLTTGSPPYLSKDYFTGTYSGYTYTPTFNNYSYSILADPVSTSAGTASYTISTGGVLTKN